MNEHKRTRLGGVMIIVISLTLIYSICKPTPQTPAQTSQGDTNAQ